jgi:hypothetical protein
MAQFTYTYSQQVATAAARHAAYTDKLPSLLVHLDALGINLLDLSWDSTTKIVTVVLDTALTAAQLTHLGYQ